MTQARRREIKSRRPALPPARSDARLKVLVDEAARLGRIVEALEDELATVAEAVGAPRGARGAELAARAAALRQGGGQIGGGGRTP